MARLECIHVIVIFLYDLFLLQNKIKDQNAAEQIWDKENGERVWLVHRGGFCAAIKSPLSSTEPGRLTIQFEHNGEQLTVDEDDIEKANPSSLDLCEDICHLKHLNEASVLHCLRQRYASNLIHTRAGPILLVVNPMAPLSLYSEKVSLYYILFGIQYFYCFSQLIIEHTINTNINNKTYLLHYVYGKRIYVIVITNNEIMKRFIQDII